MSAVLTEQTTPAATPPSARSSEAQRCRLDVAPAQGVETPCAHP